MKFEGIITALTTPFKENKVDFIALEKIINRQKEAGIKALVIAGSTGEGLALGEEEYLELITQAVEIAGSEMNIIASVSGASTWQICHKISKVQTLGISAIMCTPPFYVKPEHQGLIQHFKQVSKTSQLPIMLYLHPGRTGCNMSEQSVREVASLHNVVAIKDASSDLTGPIRLGIGDVSFMGGNDDEILPYMACGARGCVSAISNIIPVTMIRLYNLIIADQYSEARQLMAEIFPIIQVGFAESNPTCLKYLGSKLGLHSPEIRLPLNAPTPEICRKLDGVIEQILRLENA